MWEIELCLPWLGLYIDIVSSSVGVGYLTKGLSFSIDSTQMRLTAAVDHHLNGCLIFDFKFKLFANLNRSLINQFIL